MWASIILIQVDSPHLHTETAPFKVESQCLLLGGLGSSHNGVVNPTSARKHALAPLSARPLTRLKAWSQVRLACPLSSCTTRDEPLSSWPCFRDLFARVCRVIVTVGSFHATAGTSSSLPAACFGRRMQLACWQLSMYALCCTAAGIVEIESYTDPTARRHLKRRPVRPHCTALGLTPPAVAELSGLSCVHRRDVLRVSHMVSGDTSRVPDDATQPPSSFLAEQLPSLP